MRCPWSPPFPRSAFRPTAMRARWTVDRSSSLDRCYRNVTQGCAGGSCTTVRSPRAKYCADRRVLDALPQVGRDLGEFEDNCSVPRRADLTVTRNILREQLPLGVADRLRRSPQDGLVRGAPG